MKNHFWRRFEAKSCGCEQKGAFCPILLLKPMRNSQSLQTTMSCPIHPFPSAQVHALTRVFRLDGITCFHWSCEKVLPGNLLSCKLSINDDQCNGAPHVIYTSTYNPIKFQWSIKGSTSKLFITSSSLVNVSLISLEMRFQGNSKWKWVWKRFCGLWSWFQMLTFTAPLFPRTLQMILNCYRLLQIQLDCLFEAHMETTFILPTACINWLVTWQGRRKTKMSMRALPKLWSMYYTWHVNEALVIGSARDECIMIHEAHQLLVKVASG